MAPTYRTSCQRCFNLAIPNCNVLDVKTDGQSMVRCNNCAYIGRTCTLLKRLDRPPLAAQQQPQQTQAQQEASLQSLPQEGPQPSEAQGQALPTQQNEEQQPQAEQQQPRQAQPQPLSFQQAHLPPPPPPQLFYMAQQQQPQLPYGSSQQQYNPGFAAGGGGGVIMVPYVPLAPMAQESRKRGFEQTQESQPANGGQGRRNYNSVHAAKRRKRQQQERNSMLRNAQQNRQPSPQETAPWSSQGNGRWGFDRPGQWNSRRDRSRSPQADAQRHTGNSRQLLTPLEAEMQSRIAVERALHERDEHVSARERGLEQQHRERLQQAEIRWRANGQRAAAPTDNNALQQRLVEAERRLGEVTRERDAAREIDLANQRYTDNYFARMQAEYIRFGAPQQQVASDQPPATVFQGMQNPATAGEYVQPHAPVEPNVQLPASTERRVDMRVQSRGPSQRSAQQPTEWTRGIAKDHEDADKMEETLGKLQRK